MIIAIRSGDDRDDLASKPSGACAPAADPSPGKVPNQVRAPSQELVPNREWPPNRAFAGVPTAIRIGDDRDPTSKPSGASAPAAPSRERLPNLGPSREPLSPTTALGPRSQTVCRPGPDQAGPASPPQPR